MKIPLVDKSSYLKGLFITARLDKQLNEKEKEILKKISDKLGFAPDFFDETIRGLLSNKYIVDDPIVFTDNNVAKSFIKDAVKLAFADGEVSNSEIEWIKKTANINSLDDEFVTNEFKANQSLHKLWPNVELSLFSMI